MEKYILLKSEEGLRVQALKNFGDVKVGELGGFVDCEDNLSQEGICWVYPGAIVKENARVRDNAKVLDCAVISGNAVVRGYAEISERAKVKGHAVVEDHAKVFGGAKVKGHAVISEFAKIGGKMKVCGNARVGGFVELMEDAVVSETICTMNVEVPTEPKPEVEPKPEPVPKPVPEPKQELKLKVEKAVKECHKVLPRFLVSVSIMTVFTVAWIVTTFFTESSIATSVFSIISGLLATVGSISSINYGADFYFCGNDLLYLTREEKPILYNVDKFCTELKELEGQVQDEELRGVIVELSQTLIESKEWKEDLHEVHLSETVGLLRKYLALGKERPDGYEDLIRYLQFLRSQVEEVTTRRFQLQEASFAADASTLVKSIELQKW